MLEKCFDLTFQVAKGTAGKSTDTALNQNLEWKSWLKTIKTESNVDCVQAPSSLCNIVANLARQEANYF